MILSPDDLVDALKELDGWQLDNNSISKKFTFNDFKSAFAFMNSCAIVAEELQHHPDWRNVYNVVDVTLSTHDEGGITHKDISLAKRMNVNSEIFT